MIEPEKSQWTLETLGCAVVFTIVAIPFWIVLGPFYLILRTIVTIWQPYFYKKEQESWRKSCQEAARHGDYIDYPPTEGTLLGIGPWNSKSESME